VSEEEVRWLIAEERKEFIRRLREEVRYLTERDMDRVVAIALKRVIAALQR
jgi:hypothetical protein